MPDYSVLIAQLIGVHTEQVAATLRLLDEGNTIPFIARYRKEATHNLDETQIRAIEQQSARLHALEERRAAILASIEEQGKLTPELRAQIEQATQVTALEDLYAPYKPKRKTRASQARERGLEPLAQAILAQTLKGASPEIHAQAFLNAEVGTIDEALQGARDIVAEIISDDANVRGAVREKTRQWGKLTSQRDPKAEDDKGTFESYYDFSFKLNALKPHQILALNRGEAKGVLRLNLAIDERDWRGAIEAHYRPQGRSAWAEQLQLAIDDSAKRLLLPAIERDVRRIMSETAEQQAIHVFAENLRQLLTQAPLANRVIMGIDPAFRTGCKIAIIDAHSKLLTTTTIYPHEPQRQTEQSLTTLRQLIQRYGVSLIVIGNGTASRETEALVAQITRQMAGVEYAITNEAGASVYSASELARAELPDLDVSLRGAVSIARRMQDPLAELVKIDPKSIGVGLYQHDVDQKALSASLDSVVESVVNQVGVDANTASPALLRYVAGIGTKLANAIVAHRNEHGAFKSRNDLKKVAGLGAKTFEQAAGFLRVRGGKQWLDASAIHPESYAIAEAIMHRAQLKPQDSTPERDAKLNAYRTPQALASLAQELGAGVHTLSDILEQLCRPGRDPREDVPPPLLRNDVLSMDDLREGMILRGTVRNVVDFGAFIDIGVKQDGLLHSSQIPRGTRMSVGDIIEVSILGVEKDKKRIKLAWSKQD